MTRAIGLSVGIFLWLFAGCLPGELFNSVPEKTYDFDYKLESDRMECIWPQGGLYVSKPDLSWIGDDYFGRLAIPGGQYKSMGFKHYQDGKVSGCYPCLFDRPLGMLDPAILAGADPGNDLYVYGAEKWDCSVGAPLPDMGHTVFLRGVSSVYVKAIDEEWAGDVSRKMLQLLTIHEIGHQFGLDDLYDPWQQNLIMYIGEDFFNPYGDKHWGSEHEARLWQNRQLPKDHNP